MPTIELKLTLPINTATLTTGTEYKLTKGIKIYGWTLNVPAAGATDIWLPLFRLVHKGATGKRTLLPNAGEKYMVKDGIGVYVPEDIEVPAGTLAIEGVSGGTAAAHVITVTVHFMETPLFPEFPSLERTGAQMPIGEEAQG